MKCYIMKKNDLLLDIQEAEIVKETEKQFKIEFNNQVYVVNKYKQFFGDLDPKILCLSKEEANQTRLKLLKERVESKREQHWKIEEQITRIEQCIDELEKGAEQ